MDRRKVLAVIGTAAVVGIIGSALTAGNALSAAGTPTGSSVALGGYTVSDSTFALGGTDGSHVVSLHLTLDAAASAVRARVLDNAGSPIAGSSTYSKCSLDTSTATPTTDWVCDFRTPYDAAAASKLDVVAVS